MAFCPYCRESHPYTLSRTEVVHVPKTSTSHVTVSGSRRSSSYTRTTTRWVPVVNEIPTCPGCDADAEFPGADNVTNYAASREFYRRQMASRWAAVLAAIGVAVGNWWFAFFAAPEGLAGWTKVAVVVAHFALLLAAANAVAATTYWLMPTVVVDTLILVSWQLLVLLLIGVPIGLVGYFIGSLVDWETKEIAGGVAFVLVAAYRGKHFYRQAVRFSVERTAIAELGVAEPASVFRLGRWRSLGTGVVMSAVVLLVMNGLLPSRPRSEPAAAGPSGSGLGAAESQPPRATLKKSCNLREAPGTDSNVLETTPAGTDVFVIGKHRELARWMAVEVTRERFGWMHDSCLELKGK